MIVVQSRGTNSSVRGQRTGTTMTDLSGVDTKKRDATSDERMQKRCDIFALFLPRLSQMAYALTKVSGNKNDEKVLVLLDADDPRWKRTRDFLVPGQKWDVRDKPKEKRIVFGPQDFSFCAYLCAEMPSLAADFLARPLEGYVKAIVLAEGGATVFEVLPKLGETVH